MMSVLADRFPEWKDFPKGMQVMVVDEDRAVLEDVKVKLEACGYKVSAYSKEKDALEALEDGRRVFHVAVVEATVSDTLDGFKIVAAAARNLTTIMMASTENMGIMMQGIAAGASEFLQKPLSEEKLKNIWQHVVRKALSSGQVPALPMNANLLPAKPRLADTKCELPSVDAACDDEIHSAELFINQGMHCTAEEGSIFFLGDEQNSDTELLCYTPPLLEQTSRAVMDEEDAISGDGRDCDDVTERRAAILGRDWGSPRSQCRYEFVQRVSHPKRETESRNGGGDDDDMCNAYSGNCEEEYMQIKAEVEEAVNNSEVLNELFDSQPASYGLCEDYGGHDAQSPCAGEDREGQGHRLAAMEDGGASHHQDLQYQQVQQQQQQDDYMQFGQHKLDPRLCEELGMGLDVDDEDLFSLSDEGSFFAEDVGAAAAPEPPANGSGQAQQCGGVARLDCLEHADDDDCCNEEAALLLAEVAKAEMGSMQALLAFPPFPSRGPRVNETPAPSSSTTADSDAKSDSEHSSHKAGKKKMKVDWTPELHRRFVQAVEQLGVDKAIPSRILDIMGVKCLTRHNIASHLQKYRSHRKHLQAREADATSNWKPARAPPTTLSPWAAGSRPPPPQIQPRPCGPQLHVWGHPTTVVEAHAPMHFWPAWPPQQIDAWGHPTPSFYPAPQPVLRIPLAPVPGMANAAAQSQPFQASKFCNDHPPKEVVDASINEVLRNPFIPLPLGLKPPSLESVIAELQRQGITAASS